jgi:hypothetical protein
MMVHSPVLLRNTQGSFKTRIPGAVTACSRLAGSADRWLPAVRDSQGCSCKPSWFPGRILFGSLALAATAGRYWTRMTHELGREVLHLDALSALARLCDKCTPGAPG